MDDQRCFLPQIQTSEGSIKMKKSTSDYGPVRSASFSGSSDLEHLRNKNKASKQVCVLGTVVISYCKSTKKFQHLFLLT